MKRAELVEMLTRHYTQAVADYRDAVLHGRKACGAAERAKVERQERDLREGVPGYVFSMEAGLRPLLWMAINLAFPKGEKRGQALLLSPWQAWDTCTLFGWVKEDDHSRRRYTNAFIEIARKNGKSTFAGALLDYLAFGEREGVSCYIGATSLEQAEETFQRAAEALCLRKKGVTVGNSKNNKTIRWKGSRIVAISAAPRDGKLAYAAVIDEYHQHADNALINSIHSGNVSDQQALLVRITTAGVNLNGPCHEEYIKCKRVLSGELSIPRYFVSVYEMDDGDSADDRSCWGKANPNMGVSVDPTSLEDNWQYASASETDMVDFKTKNLNMWCHSLARWANMPLWMERCRWGGELVAGMEGKLAYGGLDLSKNSDFTAFTLDFPQEDGRHLQVTRFWVPENQVAAIARQCRIPLERWIAAGWVVATPGDVIDYEMVREHIVECHERYQLKFIAADRWKIQELVRIMPPWFEDVAYEFSQGLKTMDPAIRDYERAYLEGLVGDAGNECLDWMMSCAEVWQDSSGNVKLVKPKNRTATRIDGVITSVMALSNARVNGMQSFDGDIDSLITAW